MTTPLMGGADLNGTASGEPTDLQFDRPYRASPTGVRLQHAASAKQFSNVLSPSQHELRPVKTMSYNIHIHFRPLHQKVDAYAQELLNKCTMSLSFLMLYENSKSTLAAKGCRAYALVLGNPRDLELEVAHVVHKGQCLLRQCSCLPVVGRLAALDTCIAVFASNRTRSQVVPALTAAHKCKKL
eukprot:6214195-Pleurochrysis_carterae.AAC.2